MIMKRMKHAQLKKFKDAQYMGLWQCSVVSFNKRRGR